MGVRLISNFRTFVGKVDKTLPTQVMRACHAVREEWLDVLSGNRGGRTYRVPGTRRTYTASAPGEAPASRLGDLRRSIRVQPRIEPGRIQARVGSPLEYAAHLEYGTRRMAPRPHLRTAYERARPRIEEIFREGLI